MYSGKAYSLFYHEAVRQTAAGRAFLESGQCTIEQWEQLRGEFHRLRGAAGFFQLVEVRRVASELEQLCRCAAEGQEVPRARLEQLVSQLEKAVQEMSPPVPSSTSS